jgi:pimeloyl-ACP methyl ester carboxylesterase
MSVSSEFELSVRTVGARAVDLYAPFRRSGSAAVLLLHGSGASERKVMAPYAERLVHGGVVVVVPDWDAASQSVAEDLERALALAVVDSRSGGVVVVGWSAGGRAAWWLASRHPEVVVGVALVSSSLVGIVGLEDPVEALTVPVVAVTGRADAIVPEGATAAAIRKLRSLGVAVDQVVLDADHAGVIGTVYDPEVGRCVPSATPAVVAAGDACASAILGLVQRRPADG